MKFDSNFLFGAASAAYQVEGGCREDGKGISNWDVFSKISGKTLNGTNGDVAVDHYHRYKEDVKLMAEMGLESYRFSIAWTRIFPEKDGKVNEKGIQFYDNLINECLKYKIVPFITLYHWDLPQYLEEQGGWTNRETVEAFVKFANVCFERFGDRVKHWITFNETVYFLRFGYITGAHPPGRKNDQKGFFQALHNVMVAHGKAVLAYKQRDPQGEIGFSHGFAPNYQVTNAEDDRKAAFHANSFETFIYLDPVVTGAYPDYCVKSLKERELMFEISREDEEILKAASRMNDFIGLNYYHPNAVRKTLPTDVVSVDYSREGSAGKKAQYYYDGFYEIVKPEGKRYTKWGWEMSPEWLIWGIEMLNERYKKPLAFYITENGLGDQDPIIEGEVMDVARIKFMAEHLRAVGRGNETGCNIKGYFAWSFIDLLSWLNGYEKQYGFVYVDHENHMERKKKLSFYWYKHVIETRGKCLEEEM